MAYTPNTLTLAVDTIGGGAIRIHFYETEDSKATWTGSGYFQDATERGLKLNDIIFVYISSTGQSYLSIVSAVDANGNATVFTDGVILPADPAESAAAAADSASTAAAASTTAVAASTAAQTHAQDAADDLAIVQSLVATYGNGWRPEFAIYSSGQSRYAYITEWYGGGGVKPDTGYITATGGVSIDVADAVDLGALGIDTDATAIATAHGSLSDQDTAIVSATIHALKSAGIWDALDDFFDFKITGNLGWKSLAGLSVEGTGPTFGPQGAVFDGGGTNYLTGPNFRTEYDIAEDGDFSEATAWTVIDTGWFIDASDSNLAAVSTPGGDVDFFQNRDDVISLGASVEITFTVSGYDAGSVRPRIETDGSTGDGSQNGSNVSADGTYTEALTVPLSGHSGTLDAIYVGMRANSAAILNVDDFRAALVQPGNLTRKNAFIGFYEAVNASDADPVVYASDGTNYISLNPRDASDNIAGGINQTTAVSTEAGFTDSTGHVTIYRSATNARIFRDGTLAKNIAATSTLIPNADLEICKSRPSTLRLLYFGSAISESLIASMATILDNHLSGSTAIGAQGPKGEAGDGYVSILDYGALTTAAGSTNRAAWLAMEADVGYSIIPAGTFVIDGGDFEIEKTLKILPGAVLSLTTGNIASITGGIEAAEDHYFLQGEGKWRLEGQSYINAGWFGYLISNGKNVNTTNWEKFLTDNRFSNNFKTVQLMNGTYKHNAPFKHPQDCMIKGVWGTDSTVIEMYGTDEHMHVSCWVDHQNGGIITWDNNGADSLRGTPQDIGAVNVYWDGKDTMFMNTGTKKAMAYMAGVSGAFFYYAKWRGPIGVNQMDGMLLVPERPAVEKMISSEGTWTEPLFVSQYRDGSDRIIHVDVDDLTGTGSLITIQQRVGSGGSWTTYTDPNTSLGKDSDGVCVFDEDQDWIDINDGYNTGPSGDTNPAPDDIYYRIGILEDEGGEDPPPSHYVSGNIRVLLGNFNEDVRGASFTTIRECQFANGRHNLVLGRVDSVFSNDLPFSGGYGDMHGGKVFETLVERSTFKFASTVESNIYAGILLSYWDESGGHTAKGEPGPYLNHIIENRIVLGEGVAELDFTSATILPPGTVSANDPDGLGILMNVPGGSLEDDVKRFLDAGVPAALIFTNQANPEKNVRIVEVIDDENCLIHEVDVHDETRTMSEAADNKRLKRNTGVAIQVDCDGWGNEIIGNYIESGFYASILLGPNQKRAFIERNYLPVSLTRLIKWENPAGIKAHDTDIDESRPIRMRFKWSNIEDDPFNTMLDDAANPTDQAYGNDEVA